MLDALLPSDPAGRVCIRPTIESSWRGSPPCLRPTWWFGCLLPSAVDDKNSESSYESQSDSEDEEDRESSSQGSGSVFESELFSTSQTSSSYIN